MNRRALWVLVLAAAAVLPVGLREAHPSAAAAADIGNRLRAPAAPFGDAALADGAWALVSVLAYPGSSKTRSPHQQDAHAQPGARPRTCAGTLFETCAARVRLEIALAGRYGSRATTIPPPSTT